MLALLERLIIILGLFGFIFFFALTLSKIMFGMKTSSTNSEKPQKPLFIERNASYIWIIGIGVSVTATIIGILEQYDISGYVDFGVAGIGILSIYGIISFLRKKKKVKTALESLSKKKREEIHIALVEMADTISNFHACIFKCPPLKNVLFSIYTNGGILLGELTERPDNVIKLKHFMNFYLDTASSIVQKYDAITDQREKQMVLDKIQPVLVELDKVFAEKIESFRKEERFDLDVDIKLLEQEIKTRRI